MNCRVCNQPTQQLLLMSDMPAMAQHLSETAGEHRADLKLCQCVGCGLVQLENDPVFYWQENIRVYDEAMQRRINALPKVDFYSLHRLEHMPDPNACLRGFTGAGIVEVPNFDMILAKSLYAEIMLDHLMYFTEDTLRFALQYNGFEVLQIQSVWNDYILSALVRKREPINLLLFAQKRDKMKAAIDKYISCYEHVAIYGASHQAFAYIATLNLKVEFIVDNSPLKIGKYSPIGGLPIHHPDKLRDANAVIIMGAGYSDEILKHLEFDGGIAVMRDWGLEVIK